MKGDLVAGLGRLDPRARFTTAFASTVRDLLGAMPESSRGRERATVTFAVGGARAQVDIGLTLLENLREGIFDCRFRLILVAGLYRLVEKTSHDRLDQLGLESQLGHAVVIVREDSKPAYFDRFNALMRETAILWTKPSELSLYSGLEIPIVMAPSRGSQEDKNRKWLMVKSCALPHYTPRLALEWLSDMIVEGELAEKAFNGFVKSRKLGVFKIEEILRTGTMERETHPLKR